MSKEDSKTIGADILTVQYAWPVGKPLVDSLGDGIWEVRSRLENGADFIALDSVLYHPRRESGAPLPSPGQTPSWRHLDIETTAPTTPDDWRCL